MNKNDLKKIVFCGVTAGCLAVSQAAVANEKTQDDLLVLTEKTQEDVFAGGCGGGKSGCNGRSAPKNNLTPEEEEQIQNQGQGQGHSCANNGQPKPMQPRIV